MPLAHKVVLPRAPSRNPPLLVLLHGIGADEEDLLPLSASLDPRLLVVSVRAPHREGPVGYRWYAIDWTASPPRGDPGEMIASRDLLGTFIAEAATTHGADPDRVYLFGFSQGAIMSLSLLLARPDLVRGVVAHSGRLARLPGPDPTPAALSRASVLLLHGAQDGVVPADLARKALEVLRPLLGERATCRVFVDLGHGMSPESVAAAARWLTERLDA